MGGRFAPLAMLVDKDTALDSMVTHFNKAVTDTVAELLGKQRRKRKPWPTTWTQSLVMLKIIINRLHPQAEEIIAEEQLQKSRKEHHRTNIQSQDPRREIPAASAESLPCLHRLQEGLWQGMARSRKGN